MTVAGTVLSDRYELLRPIGQGGMATVWAARDQTLDREVAVKLLLSRFSEEREFLDRFAAEAQAAASLNHPNVVTVFDTGSTGRLPFMVMELVQGRSLADVVRAGGLTEQRALEVGAEVSAALAYAHDRGLVHRDIKPGNILLAEDGSVKVTDFGIARAITAETVTQTAAVLGTAAYLSPEQAQGHSVDIRTDIYSLGVTLYEVLTGTPPFAGDTAITVAYQHVQEDPVPPRDRNPALSAAAEAIVMRALAKNPVNRYQDALAMRDDLLRAHAGHAVAAPAVLRAPASAPTATLGSPVVAGAHRGEPERVGRGPLWVALAMLVLAGLAGLTVWALSSFSDQQNELVSVPDVVGEPREEARDRLESFGLDVDVSTDNDSDVEEDAVISQDVEPGTEVEIGSTVGIVVSLGAEQRLVPDVIGLTREEAEARLVEEDLVPGQVRERADDEVEAGIVLEVSPDVDSNVDVGTTISLLVSSGQELVLVTSVVGLAEVDAARQLEAQDLEVLSVREFSEAVQEGRVIRQEPDAGTEVPVGETVTIVVSNGPEEQPEPSPEPTTSEPAEPDPTDPEPDPDPTATDPTDPQPTDPDPTDPDSGDPDPTDEP